MTQQSAAWNLGYCGATARGGSLRKRVVHSIVLIVSDVVVQQSPEVALIEHDDLVEQLSAHTAYPAFRNVVLPRAPPFSLAADRAIPPWRPNAHRSLRRDANLVITQGSLNSGLAVRSSVSGGFNSDIYATRIRCDGTARLYRRNSWNWMLLASVNAGITVGPAYSVKLVAMGTNPVHLEAWINGTKWLSYHDTSASQLTAGGVGIVNYDQNISYDDFRVLRR